MRLRWLLTTLVLATILAGVHVWAQLNFIYWKVRWFDTPMHVLGGITLATFFVALIYLPPRPKLLVTLLGATFIGWEVFEFLAKLPQPAGYLLDTIHDMVNDSIGATLVFLIARDTLWRSK
jgi:hypothetical protein